MGKVANPGHTREAKPTAFAVRLAVAHTFVTIAKPYQITVTVSRINS